LLKIKGTNVQKGEALLEVETDKVNVEIEAPEDGLRDEITVQVDIAKFGAVVAVIDKTR
jgi:2-oxoglutarate dehydrogenase E2 component (dihydrolipoamide succinyltransferase)